MLIFTLLAYIHTAAGEEFNMEYPTVNLRTFVPAWLDCHVNEITNLAFTIKVSFLDATGDEVFYTRLNGKNGGANLLFSVKKGKEVSKQIALPEGYYARKPAVATSYSIVNIVYLSNNTHIGVGSRGMLSEEVAIPFTVEDVRKIKVMGYGPNLIDCEGTFGCSGPAP